MNPAIRLNPAFIPAAARTVARRSGLVAIPAIVFGAFVLLLAVLNAIAVGKGSHVYSEQPWTLALPLVGVAIIGYGIRMLVQQRRATLAAVKAHADPMSFWYLDGFTVIPYVRGVPDRSLSFAVPPQMRVHLASAGRFVPPA